MVPVKTPGCSSTRMPSSKAAVAFEQNTLTIPLHLYDFRAWGLLQKDYHKEGIPTSIS